MVTRRVLKAPWHRGSCGLPQQLSPLKGGCCCHAAPHGHGQWKGLPPASQNLDTLENLQSHLSSSGGGEEVIFRKSVPGAWGGGSGNGVECLTPLNAGLQEAGEGGLHFLFCASGSALLPVPGCLPSDCPPAPAVNFGSPGRGGGL